jgi:hypothetical protein
MTGAHLEQWFQVWLLVMRVLGEGGGAPAVLTMGRRRSGSGGMQRIMKRGGGNHSSTSGRSSGHGGAKVKRGMGAGGGVVGIMGAFYRVGGD